MQNRWTLSQVYCMHSLVDRLTGTIRIIIIIVVVYFDNKYLETKLILKLILDFYSCGWYVNIVKNVCDVGL